MLTVTQVLRTKKHFKDGYKNTQRIHSLYDILTSIAFQWFMNLQKFTMKTRIQLLNILYYLSAQYLIVEGAYIG